ncbi:arylamine N-acetyltransferase [Streptomyces sp. NPDC006482]|uniref:arylamine N-acetyltransferase family protein n=1 Tax=unclassified Streptomyces TaxID=2593676 RepID=UPI00225AE3AE|nr:arylamine N-acetyltransferase [Streptomyces sp. NBC_00094]MCX5390528.1 arylamine N-acetyltransferase [Streptomyces sp. NBC_00094]
MFDIDHYLGKLGHTGPHPAPTLETLRVLHKAHLMTVPFDNFLNAERGTAIWDGVDIDVDLVFKEVIVGGRGGVCYELNGLFRALLGRLGFEVVVFSAGVRGPDGSFGPELEHLFNGVRVDGEWYLADVGYSGPSLIEPVRVSPEAQEQYGSEFRVVESSAADPDGEGFHYLERKPRDGEWATIHRFRLTAREFSEWLDAENPVLDEYARMLAANVTYIRGRALENGQLTLTGRRLLTVEDGRETVRVLVKQPDLDAVIKNILLQD